MALSSSTIIGKAKLLLQDETSIRWTESELTGWIASALAEIVLMKPNACVKNKSITLTSGSKQSIAAGDIQLIDVIRNVGGGAITLVNRNVLDVTIPGWHTSTAGTPKHWCFDPRDPKTFYVYPPASSGSVEATVATMPATVADLDDVYEAPVLDYLMYRAYSKDSEHTANMQRSTSHYQAFVGSLQGKLQGEAVFAPKAMFGNNPIGTIPTQQQG